MEDLFPEAIRSVSKASESIETGLAKVFTFDRKSLTDEQWTEYGDCLESLHTRLMQLNNTIHIGYSFAEGLPGDVINYTKLLKEYEKPCIARIAGMSMKIFF